jgi:hypothetical protein
MTVHSLRVSFALRLIGVVGILAGTSSASAVVVDFENPPYVAGGTVVGQDGWATNGYVLADPFFGGVVNGTVDVSTSGPLVGAQSLLYQQTVDPPAAGSTGASDVGKAGVIVGVEGGTDAIDLSASFLLQSDANSIGNGGLGFFLGQGGRSPIFLLLNNVSSAGGTGEILVGQDAPGPVLSNVGAYQGNDVVEFTFGVDLDNQNYDVWMRNVTDGTPTVQLLGAGPNGRFPFFGGAISDNGDGVSYTLDASLLLRAGVGRVDQITLTVIPEPTALVLILICGAWTALAARATRR